MLRNLFTSVPTFAMINLTQEIGDPEINNRIQLAVSKFTDMRNLLQNMRINLKTRVKFLDSFVRSTLTYACQNWNVSKTQMDRLDVTYRGFLRRMVRGGFHFVNESENDYRYRISNEQLHNLCGSFDVSCFIRKQQQNYMKHVIRMPLDRSVKMLAFNCDNYTKRGRPCKTLLDQVVYIYFSSRPNYVCDTNISYGTRVRSSYRGKATEKDIYTIFRYRANL